MNQNRLIIGGSIAVVLMLLLAVGLTQWKRERARAGQRSPLSEIAYCNPEDVRPCIVSFGLDSDGNMLVNILIPPDSFPAFYLKIVHAKGESRYDCDKVKNFPENVYCIGETMPVGEVLQFLIFSTREDVLLAEGKFAIIGLALPTPEGGLALTTSPTPDEFPVTSTPPGPKSTPSPSYPNPPYPNPSPSYP